MDVDIDFPTSFDPLTIFSDAVRASMIKDGKLSKHPAGVYLQAMPSDPITGLAAIPYNHAEDHGYMKIDFLHLSVLDAFENKQQIRALLDKEPDWDMLTIDTVVAKLFQIHKHGDLLYEIEPRSVIELADCIALIRPGKRHLLDEYRKNTTKVRKMLYQKPTDNKYYFKKSHAIAYSLTIVLQLHLIKAGII